MLIRHLILILVLSKQVFNLPPTGNNVTVTISSIRLQLFSTGNKSVMVNRSGHHPWLLKRLVISPLSECHKP